MADLTQLSNDQLLSLEQQVRGQQSDLSNLSNEQLLALEQQQQPQTFRQPESVVDTTGQKSPLSVLERMQLSFADDRGRKQWLEQRYTFVQQLPNGKFAAGDNPQTALPIDPEGVFNDVLGDMADVVSAIPVIAGQIGGVIAGTPGGPAGIIAGGALGAAGGEAISQTIGKLVGVSKRKPMEVATDIAIVGAFGAIGEGIGQAFKFAGRGLSKFAAKSLDKALRRTPDPSRGLKNLGKLFKITAAVDETDVIEAGLYGFERTLKGPYTNPGFINTLKTKFINNVIAKNKALGKAVGVGDDWARANFGGKSLELRPLGTQLLNELSDPSVGIVDGAGRLSRGAFTEGADFRTIKQLTDLFFNKNPKTNQLLPKNLKFSQLIDYKKRMSTGLRSYFKSGRVNPKAERAIAQYLDGVGDVANKILPPNNPYTKANAAFRGWKQNLQLLKQEGLNLDDVTSLEKLFREDVAISSKIENYMVRLQKKTSSANEMFRIITEQLPERFPRGGIGNTAGTLLDELRKFNAAQGFAASNPNFLRLTAVAGLVGLGHVISPATPEGTLSRIGLGVLLSTPGGVKWLLRTGGKTKAAWGKGVLTKLLSAERIDPRLMTSLLSRLLETKVKSPQ